MITTALIRPRALRTGTETPKLSAGQEALARKIDLALPIQPLKLHNFFPYVPHAGRLRFCLSHNDELQTLPRWFRRTRLTLQYTTEVNRADDGYLQYVALSGPFFNQTLEAVGVQRPRSKQSSYAWRWICPRCEQGVDLLLARIGQDFKCSNCRGRGGEYFLAATFAALPSGGAVNVQTLD